MPKVLNLLSPRTPWRLFVFCRFPYRNTPLRRNAGGLFDAGWNARMGSASVQALLPTVGRHPDAVGWSLFVVCRTFACFASEGRPPVAGDPPAVEAIALQVVVEPVEDVGQLRFMKSIFPSGMTGSSSRAICSVSRSANPAG